MCCRDSLGFDNPAYLSRFLFSGLHCVAPYCVPCGVRVVSASMNKGQSKDSSLNIYEETDVNAIIEPEGKVREVPNMEIELLYFDGCPSYRTAEKILREVLAKEGMEADVELVAVNSDEEARKIRFPVSPTIRLDGQDLFPVAEREDWSLGCRVYATPEGLKGSPTAEMLRETLRR